MSQEQELYGMKLHDRCYVSDEMHVTRVPGGWIYTTCRLDQQAMTSVFVPFDDEMEPLEL